MTEEPHKKWSTKYYEWARPIIKDPNPRVIIFPVKISPYTNPNLDPEWLKLAREEIESKAKPRFFEAYYQQEIVLTAMPKDPVESKVIYSD